MKLYFKYFKVHFKSCMQYKTSFILSFISQILVFFTYYYTILCLFNKFSNINGFTLYEVLLTFSIIQFGSSFCEAFFRGLDQFDHLILRGDFDKLLLRPRNILLQSTCEEINFIKLSKVIQSIIILVIAIIKIDINWNISKIITVIFMLFSSIIVFFGLLVLAATYCFYTVKGLEVRNVFTCGCRDMAEYPIGVFKKGIIFFLTYILPFGFVNYYPLLYILGRTNNKIYMYSPLFSILYLIPCILLFYKGLKKYSSTGS